MLCLRGSGLLMSIAIGLFLSFYIPIIEGVWDASLIGLDIVGGAS